MSLFSRARLIARVKVNTALDAMEDPTQTLDYAVTAQRELVQRVNRGLVEVATSRQRLERQAATLRDRIAALDGQARRAVEAGRDDLARTALERKQAVLGEVAATEEASASLAEEERQLSAASRRLATRVDQFTTRRTIMTARYEAASARNRAGEALTGITDDLGDLSAAIHRAEERTEKLAARASALDVLIETGTLDVSLSSDHVETELQGIAAKRAVEAELRQLQEALRPADAS